MKVAVSLMFAGGKLPLRPRARQGGDFNGMNVFAGDKLGDVAFYAKTRTSTRNCVSIA